MYVDSDEDDDDRTTTTMMRWYDDDRFGAEYRVLGHILGVPCFQRESSRGMYALPGIYVL